ncbi:MAG TPA: LuxR C-terminal-related transcriptional regulator, partial [Ktedonosporobacter sp.]|nr:LuxR C-terminal-related transcriptional regulator [Ktedonosporobacter sp.]
LSQQHGKSCLLWGVAWTQGISYFNVGLVAAQDGHYTEGKAALRESVRQCSRSGDRLFPIWANLLLGEIIALEGKDEEARPLLEQSRTASRTLEMKALESEALRYLGLLVQHEGDLEQAEGLLAESLHLAREVDDAQCLIWALIWTARVKMAQQHLKEAREVLEEALETSLARNDPLTMPAGLEGLGYVVAMQRKPVWAVQLFGCAQALRERMGAPLPPMDRLEYEGQIAAVRLQLDPVTYRTAWIQGREMTVEHVLDAQGETASQAAVPPRTTTLPAQAVTLGLTRRELDVLRLLAQGLTNAQIAEQLVLSVVTVNSYLRTIYSKLAVASRTAAARYALDHGLI